MPRRFNGAPLKSTDRLNQDTLNPLFVKLDAAVAALEEVKLLWDEQVLLFNTNALKRVTEAIKPLIDQLNTAIDGGFLVAQTDDLVEIVEGEEVSFFIPEGARVAFRPTPFVAVMAPDEYEDWAIGRVLAYSDSTGLLTVDVIYLHGSGGERAGWTVAASSGVVEAVSDWLSQITAMRDEVVAQAQQVADDLAEVVADKATILGYKTAAETAATQAGTARASAQGYAQDAFNSAAAAEGFAASIAGGPVSTVNGRVGPHITGLAEASDVAFALATRDTAIGLKADSAATTAALDQKADATATANAIAAIDAKAVELTADFVASGAIAAGKFVVLRPDGKVEQVSGSEVALSLGTAVQLGTSSIDFVDAQYNAATGKVAVLYRNSGTFFVVVGTVSGTMLSFDTPHQLVNTGSTSYQGKLAWRSDGTKIVVCYPHPTGTANIWCGILVVSGTTLTNPNGISSLAAPNTTTPVNFLTWESVSDRVIMVFSSLRAVAGTVTSNAISWGTQVNTGVSPAGCHFNETASRLVVWDNAASQTVAAATISGTSITFGAGAVSPITQTPKATEASATGELMIVGTLVSQGVYYAAVATYSGNTVSFSATVKVSDIASNDAISNRLAYSPADDKFVIAQTESSARSFLHEGTRFFVASIVGGAPSLSEPTLYPDVYQGSTFAFTTDGIAILVANLTSKLGVQYQLAGRIQNGKFILASSGNLNSTLPTSVQIWVMISGKVISFYNSTNRFAVVMVPASFTGNAGDWFGVAEASVTNGQSVAVKLKGAVVGGQTGLTIGATHYLAADGTVSANDNGRPVGVAISATKLRLAA